MTSGTKQSRKYRRPVRSEKPVLEMETAYLDGWPNEATYALALVIDNNQFLLDYCRQVARDKRYRVYQREDDLQQFIERHTVYVNKSAFRTRTEQLLTLSLMQSALNLINWKELRLHLAKDC